MEASADHRGWLRNRRDWLRGIFLAVAGLTVAYIAMIDSLSDSMNQLKETEKSYSIKSALVTQREQIEKRVSMHRAALDAIEKQIVPEDEVSEFNQEAVRDARSVGCYVSSVRPLPSRVLSMDDDKSKKKRKKKPPAMEPVEWPLLLSLRAEYSHLKSFLALLFESEHRVGIRRLIVNPTPENPKVLACSLEIVCYGLVKPDKEKRP